MSMRIDPTRKSSVPDLEGLSTSNRGEADFQKILSQTQKLKRQELQDFLYELQAQGEKLANTRSLRNLKDFQDRVRSFLRSTLGQSRTLSEEQVWDFRGRPKVMARVTQIDHALEELGKKVLDEQAKPLDILAKIDEIRGLIIDLLA